jgi:uncharacterized protein (DUF1330 family)
MSAFLIADIDVNDTEAYDKYRAANPGIVKKFGGRYLAAGGAVRVIEGDWTPARVVIIEFPDMAAITAFYESPEYVALRQIRWKSAKSRLVVVEALVPSG